MHYILPPCKVFYVCVCHMSLEQIVEIFQNCRGKCCEEICYV